MAIAKIVGKKFFKKVQSEVIDATENTVFLQDVNKTDASYFVTKEEFENDYVLGEAILRHLDKTKDDKTEKIEKIEKIEKGKK